MGEIQKEGVGEIQNEGVDEIQEEGAGEIQKEGEGSGMGKGMRGKSKGMSGAGMGGQPKEIEHHYRKCKNIVRERPATPLPRSLKRLSLTRSVICILRNNIR